MALFYTGKRPVTKGRNSSESVHHWKGTAGKYSNYSIFNPSHIFDGAPNTNHTPGSGRHPGSVMLSQMFNGEFASYPITNVGGGTRIDGMRYRPLEKKATGGAQVFGTGWGHVVRESDYRHDLYSHENRTERLDDVGHSKRTDETGAPATFGHFGPYEHKGTANGPLVDSGYAYPTGYDNLYGKNRVQEWQGVASAKALNV